jgi:hypothetical protein
MDVVLDGGKLDAEPHGNRLFVMPPSLKAAI